MPRSAACSAALLLALAGAARAQCDAAWVKASDGDTTDFFGYSLAVCQEWLAVGALPDAEPDADRGRKAGADENGGHDTADNARNGKDFAYESAHERDQRGRQDHKGNDNVDNHA